MSSARPARASPRPSVNATHHGALSPTCNPTGVSGHASQKRLRDAQPSSEPTSTDGDFSPGSWTPGSK